MKLHTNVLKMKETNMCFYEIKEHGMEQYCHMPPFSFDCQPMKGCMRLHELFIGAVMKCSSEYISDSCNSSFEL
jgi:hypothetical protein